jgi:hypothetical protein
VQEENRKHAVRELSEEIHTPTNVRVADVGDRDKGRLDDESMSEEQGTFLNFVLCQPWSTDKQMQGSSSKSPPQRLCMDQRGVTGEQAGR